MIEEEMVRVPDKPTPIPTSSSAGMSSNKRDKNDDVQPKERKKHVLFIDGSKRFTKGKNQNELSTTDVQDLFDTYVKAGSDGKADIAARLVPHEEIAGNKFDLNIGRYLKTAAAEVVDVATALAALDEARTNLAAAEKAMRERLKAAGYEG